MTQSYGIDMWLIALLSLVPLSSLHSLYNGMDLEEKKLKKELNKARLKKELREIYNDGE